MNRIITNSDTLTSRPATPAEIADMARWEAEGTAKREEARCDHLVNTTQRLSHVRELVHAVLRRSYCAPFVSDAHLDLHRFRIGLQVDQQSPGSQRAVDFPQDVTDVLGRQSSK